MNFISYDDGFQGHLKDLTHLSVSIAKSSPNITARITQMAGSGAGVSKFDLERLFGQNDLLRFNYLQRGIIAGNSVARIRVSAPFGAGGNWGTGFLITPRLIITNHHVIHSPEEALASTVEFGYQTDLNDTLQSGKTFRLNPAQTFMTSGEEELDYTIVAIEEISVDGAVKAIDYGFIRLIADTHKVDALEYVSIIQHPNGDEKCIAIRENKVIKIGDSLGGRKDNLIWYVCDTAQGSSGAPVFNDQWQLIGLHHKAVAETKTDSGAILVKMKNGQWIPEEAAQFQDANISYLANEGIRISRIVEDIKKQHPLKQYPFIQELIDDVDGVQAIGGTVPKASIVAGPPSAIATPSATGLTAGENKAFGVEAVTKKIRPIEYYDYRTGYDENFLQTPLALPEVGADALKFGEIAMVHNTNDNILRYTHFSIVFNRTRKLPFFTAVNIDGTTYTGQTRGTDVWYYDPRIDIEAQIGDDMYTHEPAEYGQKGWFDRGHLVRRLDPVWGDDPAVAALGDEDTFHWANCSPQYWGFNQGASLWGGLENYILYNTNDENVRATVFSGPVFDLVDEVHRGVPIPKFFWKVVAVESTNGALYTSAYIVDQSKWATNIPFEELPVGQFENFQVPVAKIQVKTGLLFSAAILDADVLKDQPDIPLRGLAQIHHPKR